MGVYSQIHNEEKLSLTNSTSTMEYEFKASEDNTYDDYFSAYFTEYRSNSKTKTDVYKEHLHTASKNKLIDIAIEGHKNYQWANDLAYDRGLEINSLKTEIEALNTRLTNNIAVTNRKVNNYKTACFVTIGICVLSISVFYIYQFIRYRLKKYADKIRTETIKELKNQ